jgi:hypothetical protein
MFSDTGLSNLPKKLALSIFLFLIMVFRAVIRVQYIVRKL